MTLKLDIRDRRLLYALDKNARATYSDLAKSAGVSKQVARYRISAFEREGLVNTYFAIIDAARLGYTIRKAFIKLQNADEKHESELINQLKENPNVVWLASSDGQFDICFGMRSENIEKYTEQLADLDNKFGHLFLERQIAPIVKGQYFYRDYLVANDSGTERELAFGSVPVKRELDDKYWKILVELGKNARTPITDLAEKVSLSPDAVSKRLKNLETNGVIQGYTLILNNHVLGQLHYKVLIHLKSVTSKRYNSLLSFCKLHPNIFYLVKTFGVWDLEVDIKVPGVPEFRSIMRDLKEEYADIIRDYSYISIYKIHKYNFCPSLP